MNKTLEKTNKALLTDRRRFLEYMGKCGLSSAFLRASPLALALMGSRYAEAAGAAGKKFILIYHPNGKPENAYGGGGKVSMTSTPLKPFASHVANVAALEMTISQPGQHGNLWLAAGASSYNSNDLKANSVNVQASNVLGNTTAFRSLQLGVFSGDNAGTEPTSGSQTAGIDRLKGQPLAREWNSHRAIASIFRDTPTAPTPTPGVTGPSAFQRRLSAYDANMKALDALESKLGQDEKAKLASHRAAVARLQARAKTQQTEFLASQNTGSGSSSGACGTPSVSPVGTSALQEYKSQVDVAVAALKCGLTNVCSIQFSETQASWKPNDGTADAVTGLNAGQDHHNGGNHGNPATLPDILAYMNKGVAHLIAQLKKEGLFQDTVVCVISEMGEGINHLPSHGPITVASGINGFRAGAKRVSSEHSEIFTDVFKLLGLESSIGKTVGDYGRGGIVV